MAGGERHRLVVRVPACGAEKGVVAPGHHWVGFAATFLHNSAPGGDFLLNPSENPTPGLAMDPDQSLLSRYHQQGDASAFQDLVLAHSGMVVATARRITQDAALAEEVAQEVFLTLARRSRDIRGSVAAWLHQVAKQKACNVIRGESRRRRYEQAAAPSLHPAPESTWEEIEPLVDEALTELPEPVRSLLIGHYLERRTQADIARRQGLSQSTVSRQLESGLQQLRDSLRRKGLVCGAGLGAQLLESAAAVAVSPGLTASLLKIGLSGIGSRAAGLAAAPAAATVTALKLKVASALLGVLGLGWVAIDLASRDSRLARLFASKPEPIAAASAGVGASSGNADAIARSQEARWATEAREIWANVPKVDLEAILRVRHTFMADHGHDADEFFTALGSIGIRLSRTTFDRLMADHLRVREALLPSVLWNRVIETWVSQTPREALAWTYGFRNQDEFWESEVCTLFFRATDAIQRNPEAWAAFLAASPDPAKLTALSDFCLSVEDNLAILWSQGAALGLDTDVLKAAATHYITTGEPARVLQMLERCPDPDFKQMALLRLTPRLRPDQLLRVANEWAADASLTNFLQAMAGRDGASFTDAAAFARAMAKKGGWDVTLDRWAAECVEQIYAHWVKADPAGSLTHAMDSKSQDHLERFMVEAVRSASLSEEALAAALAEKQVAQRDTALAAFYRAQAGGDPVETLHRIGQSAFITDQIEAAKPILKDWSKAVPEAAAQWLQSLPASEDHAELATVIVSDWVDGDAKAAITFARQQNLPLTRFSAALAFGLCDDSDAVVTPLLQTFRDDAEFNRLVVMLAGYRLPNEPAKAFGFMAAHARPGWQAESVRETNRMLTTADSRAEDFALALPSQNLSSVPPGQLVTLAERLMPKLQKNDRLPDGLDWTLKLPAAVAPQARAAALEQLANLQPAQRRQLDQWLARAPSTPPSAQRCNSNWPSSPPPSRRPNRTGSPPMPASGNQESVHEAFSIRRAPLRAAAAAEAWQWTIETHGQDCISAPAVRCFCCEVVMFCS